MAAAPASSSLDVSFEGPVLSLINKRLRALKKKINRISQMEEGLSQGKVLNKEQEETLRSKSSVLASIDELEKLRQPLLQALDQEIQLAIEKNQKLDAQTSGTEPEVGVEVEDRTETDRDSVSDVSDLLILLYFGTIFDVKTLMGAHENIVTRTHERNSCLTYDYVTDDDTAGDPLKDWDLDLISMLGGLLISRPVNSSSSHKDALQKCVEHAKLWLANSDQPIDPNTVITYSYLREKLNKIMASDYLTITPEIKASVEMTAAAAAGHYTSLQAPLHGSEIPPATVAASVDGFNDDYQKQGEQSTNFYGAEEIHQEDSHEEISPEVQVHAGDSKMDQNKDINYEDHNPSRRRPYQNYRGRGGRGRRPYTPGRGWRGGNHGYQNGHSQFHEQSFGYYPRNSHFRGRGGRGLPSSHYAHDGELEY